MTRYFLKNSLADPAFESYLRDTHRMMDYRDVRDKLLPKLFESMEDLTNEAGCKFSCTNRFEGSDPALRIQTPAGFIPEVIHIEFPPRHEIFRVKQGGQEILLQGFDLLSSHLRAVLLMGFAHWRINSH